MPRISVVYLLLTVLVVVALWYIRRWWMLEHGRRTMRGLRPPDLGIGFGTNFFDTLGIGSFAPTTAIFKFLKRMPDEEIPGPSMSVRPCQPSPEALIFIAMFAMDLTTLIPMMSHPGAEFRAFSVPPTRCAHCPSSGCTGSSWEWCSTPQFPCCSRPARSR